MTYFSLRSNLYRILLSFHLANFMSRLALFKGTNTYETSFSPSGPSTTCNASSNLPWKNRTNDEQETLGFFFPGLLLLYKWMLVQINWTWPCTWQQNCFYIILHPRHEERSFHCSSSTNDSSFYYVNPHEQLARPQYTIYVIKLLVCLKTVKHTCNICCSVSVNLKPS